MKKNIISIFLGVALLLTSVSSVLAHVTVKPGNVGVGAFQTFTVSVPNEKGVAVTKMRLVLPEGLEHVSPTLKSGWRVDMVHDEADGVEMSMDASTHPEHKIKEIIWSGNIPEGYRDEFSFSAKVPANEGNLVWKAYQSYADGTTVSWELTPDMEQPKDAKGNADFSKFGPASVTKVVNDLSATPAPVSGSQKSGNTVAYVALALSAISLGLHFAKKS